MPKILKIFLRLQLFPVPVPDTAAAASRYDSWKSESLYSPLTFPLCGVQTAAYPAFSPEDRRIATDSAPYFPDPPWSSGPAPDPPADSLRPVVPVFPYSFSGGRQHFVLCVPLPRLHGSAEFFPCLVICPFPLLSSARLPRTDRWVPAWNNNIPDAR